LPLIAGDCQQKPLDMTIFAIKKSEVAAYSK